MVEGVAKEVLAKVYIAILQSIDAEAGTPRFEKHCNLVTHALSSGHQSTIDPICLLEFQEQPIVAPQRREQHWGTAGI
jgi:hypothetical protein